MNNAAFCDVMPRNLLLSVRASLRNVYPANEGCTLLLKSHNFYQNIQRHIADEGNLPAYDSFQIYIM
jgi:hypothetical protein